MVLAISLVSFSGMAMGFDLGKLLEDRLNKELNKDRKHNRHLPTGSDNQSASGASTNRSRAAAATKQKVDANQLVALFGDYSIEEENRIGKQISATCWARVAGAGR